MASNVLYPPIVNSYIPAFIANENATCRIYFALSKFNGISDFENCHVSIYKQDSGLNVVNKARETTDNIYSATGILINVPVTKVELEENKYYVEINNSDLTNGWQEGWVYKIQLRLSSVSYTQESTSELNTTQAKWLDDNANNFSEWSTICITKSIGKVKLNIPNYNYQRAEENLINNTATVDSLNFVGDYQSINDADETLYSYKVQLYNNSNELIEDSGILYANQYYNINQFSYDFKTEPINNSVYKVVFSYETLNKFTETITFSLTISREEESTISVYVATAENDNNNILSAITNIFMEEEEGRVGLQLYADSIETDLDVMIRRADSRDNFQTWTDIKQLTLTAENINSLPIVYDYTVESGIWYKYGVQKYKKDNNSIIRGPLNIIENPVMRDFNYSFILGQDNQQLKLQFNHTLSNYKINVSESKNTTLGGVYPFVVRNGATRYKTFSINGLISFNMDENGLFLTKEKAFQFEEIKALYDNYNRANSISQYDYIYEKEFRDAVMTFLYDGKPKLFKSPTEGNILVRLTDINLTPQMNSRLIYNFSAIVNEIGKASIDNYKKYGLQN